MSIFEQLQNNKGTISSALGKELAEKALSGKTEIITEAVALCVYDWENAEAKSIRSGAAKIVEIVAEKNPGVIAPYLEKLLAGLNVIEPQTRWMIMRTMGFCTHLNPQVAEKALPYAEKFVTIKEGLVIASSADLFLGDYGALSEKAAKKVFPLLEISVSNYVLNEDDWLLEAFMKIARNLGTKAREKIRAFAESREHNSKKATQGRVKKLLKMLTE